MTKDEFLKKANLTADIYTAFVYDSPSNRLQFTEGFADIIDGYLDGASHYSIESIDRSSEVGQVICDNFSQIDEIITGKLIVAHFCDVDDTEVYILCPAAQI